MSSQIDLNNPPANHNFNVSIDPAETKEERFVRLFKDVLLFLFAMTVAAVIVWLCYSTLDSSSATAEEKKWAMSAMTGALGALVGYLVKK